MNILQINKFFYLKGGAERYYFDLVKILEENGHRVIPFAMQDIKNQPTKYKNYFVSKIDISKPGFSLADLKAAGRILYSFEAQSKMEDILHDFKIDIAHVHNLYHQISPSVLTTLNNYHVPVVMTIHDFKLMCPVYTFYTQGEVCERCKKSRYYNCVLRKCAKNSYAASITNMIEMYLHRMLKIYRDNVDLYISPSKFVRDKMIEFGWPRKKIITIPHFSKPKNKISEIKNKQGEYSFYFGRLIKHKGVMHMLKAYKYLKNEKLKIAGTGPQEKEYKDYVKKNKMSNVEFVGFLNDKELEDAIKLSKYVIVPSVYYETFGLSVTEAFAQGKMVIATDLGPLPELVKNGKTGIIYRAGDWRDLKNKILEINKKPQEITRLGQNALRFVRNNLDPKDHYQKIIQQYQKLIKN